jgi:hypothetical protein
LHLATSAISAFTGIHVYWSFYFASFPDNVEMSLLLLAISLVSLFLSYKYYCWYHCFYNIPAVIIVGGGIQAFAADPAVHWCPSAPGFPVVAGIPSVAGINTVVYLPYLQ